MKNKLLKYTGLIALSLLIFMDIYWIIICGRMNERGIYLDRQLRKEMLINNELKTDLQDHIKEQEFTFKLLSKHIDFKEISDSTSLFVFIPSNSCSSCVERLFVLLSQKSELKNSTFLICNSNDSFITNTWKNQINNYIVRLDAIPSIFNLKNKPLLFYVDIENQQVKYLWENSLSPEMTIFFIEHFINDRRSAPSCL